MAIDPICNMSVDEKTALYKSEYKGATYYFCAPGCQKVLMRILRNIWVITKSTTKNIICMDVVGTKEV